MFHIVFTPSGAGFLRRGLRSMGVKEPVIPFPDDLCFGPIDDFDNSDRAKWINEKLYPADSMWLKVAAENNFPSLEEETRDFWLRTLAYNACTVWVTQRVAKEYCGFLAWVERAGSRVYNVVDLTDELNIQDEPIVSLAFADPVRVDYERLLTTAKPLDTLAHDEYLATWTLLRQENSPLRVLADGKLISAPITIFDELLLSCVREDWRKAWHVAADANAAAWDEAPVTDMRIFMARLFALVEDGRIEANGSRDSWWESAEVRLPSDVQKSCRPRENVVA